MSIDEIGVSQLIVTIVVFSLTVAIAVTVAVLTWRRYRDWRARVHRRRLARRDD